MLRQPSIDFLSKLSEAPIPIMAREGIRPGIYRRLIGGLYACIEERVSPYPEHRSLIALPHLVITQSGLDFLKGLAKC